MNIKRALITAAVQLLAANTNLIRRPDPREELLAALFGMTVENHEEEVIRKTEEAVDKAVETVKHARVKRQFNKIVQHL